MKVFGGLFYDSWVRDFTWRLSTTTALRETLRSGTPAILRAPLTFPDGVGSEERAEVFRGARLTLQSLMNEVLANTDSGITPEMIFWGASPNERSLAQQPSNIYITQHISVIHCSLVRFSLSYLCRNAEVILQPHRRYTDHGP